MRLKPRRANLGTDSFRPRLLHTRAHVEDGAYRTFWGTDHMPPYNTGRCKWVNVLLVGEPTLLTLAFVLPRSISDITNVEKTSPHLLNKGIF